jgi:hypothetical protein
MTTFMCIDEHWSTTAANRITSRALMMPMYLAMTIEIFLYIVSDLVQAGHIGHKADNLLPVLDSRDGIRQMKPTESLSIF